MATIAFIGLGNMGGPMAANLVKAGHTVRGFDPMSPQDERVARVDSPAAAAAGADILITMLPSGAHLLDVYKSEGVLTGLNAGGLVIDCSTCDVDSTRQAHGLAGDLGLASLDAPVSGGVGGATAGTLTFMVGGEASAVERASEVLSIMGGKTVHCGAAGSGQAAKICNNMILGISMIGVAEAFVLAEQLGLSHQSLFDVASTSSGQCWSLTSYCPVPGPVPTSPSNNDYKPGFAAALMLKDLRLSQAAGANTPLGALAERIYTAFADAGGGGVDFSGIVRHLRDQGGAAPKA